MAALTFQHLCAQSSKSIQDSLEARLTIIQDTYYYSDLDSALLLFQQTADAASKHKLLLVQLSAILDMAWCSLDYNELNLFENYLKQGYALITKNKKELDSLDTDREIQSQFKYTSAMFHYTLGEFEQAITDFNSILYNNNKLLRVDSILAFNTYTSIGKSYFNLGNFDKAIETYNSAYRNIPHQSKSYFGSFDYDYYFALNRSQVGEAYFNKELVDPESRGYNAASTYYYTALHKLKTKKADNSIKNLLLTNYNRLAALHQHLAMYDSALYYLNKSLLTQPKNDTELTKTYILLGNIHLELKNYKKANDFYQMRLDRLNKDFPGKHYSKGTALYHLGKVCAAQNNNSEALKYYQKSLCHLVPDFNEERQVYKNPALTIINLNSTNEVMAVLLLKAKALKSVSKDSKQNAASLSAALQTYNLLSDLVDKMRRDFPSKEFKEFLSSKSIILYEDALDAAYTANQTNPDVDLLNSAFRFSEKCKSMLLLESFKNSNAKVFAGIPNHLLENENDLVNKIMYLNAALFKSADPEKEIGLKNTIARLQQDYQNLVLRLERQYPTYYKLKYNINSVSIKQVQNEILETTKEAFVEYYFGIDNIYAFVITKSTTNFFKLPSSSDILIRVTATRDGLLQKDFNKYATTAFELYSNIFAGVDQVLRNQGIKKVTIVADGHLHYIPFEILVTKSPLATSNFANLEYLIKDYQITYQYSATLIAESRLYKRLPVSKTVLGYAPDFLNPISNNANHDNVGNEGMQGLKGSLQELESIKRNLSGSYYFGERATEESFKLLSDEYKILHLATHAIIDDRNPHLSRLIFGDKGNTSEDGSLYSYELYNLKLNAELVTLSACNTGSGKLQRGEGLMNLARGFMFAGCTNVVMSLWPASDQSTANIMELFYEGIKKGLSKDEALRNAKLSYLNNSSPLTANPYYWGSFVFVGDPSPLKVDTRINFLAYAVGFLVVAVGLTFLKLKRKHRFGVLNDRK